MHCACAPVQTMNMEERGCILLTFFWGVGCLYSFEYTDACHFNSLSISHLPSPCLAGDSDTRKMQILPLKSFPSAKGGERLVELHM